MRKRIEEEREEAALVEKTEEAVSSFGSLSEHVVVVATVSVSSSLICRKRSGMLMVSTAVVV